MKRNFKASILSLVIVLSLILPANAAKLDANVQNSIIRAPKPQSVQVTQETKNKESKVRAQDDFFEYVNGKFIIESKDDTKASPGATAAENAPAEQPGKRTTLQNLATS